jgi:peroxiredoxin
MKIHIHLISTLLICFAQGALSAQAPSFSGTTLKGESLSFNGAEVGKPTLVVFWASWCSICMREIPALKAEWQSRQGQLNILAVNLDRTPAKGLAVVEKRQLPYPSVKDGDLAIADQFGVRGTPALFVIGPDGEVLHKTNRLKNALAYLDNTLPPTQ